MKIVFVRQNICMNSATQHPMVYAGVYIYDTFKEHYPFFDMNNEEYFYITDYTPIPDGTKVKYRNNFYYTKFNPDNIKCSKRNGNFSKDALGNWDIYYELYKSPTDMKSGPMTVRESYFDICVSYYFINSEGAICKAYEGQKPEADSWRKKIHNYFTSKDAALACRVKLGADNIDVNITYKITD